MKSDTWTHQEVTGSRDIPYKNCLKIMNLPSLVYRRYRGDIIEQVSARNVFVPSDSLLRKAQPSALRGHDYKLLKRHCHSQLRLQFFYFRVINLLNCLPEEVVSTPSLNAFKARLDKDWDRCQFSI